MTLKKLTFIALFLLCQSILAQNDSVVQLQEVIISDTQLHDYSDTQSVQHLNDSVIARNSASLTALLSYNTVVYFKENGLGMVSSPSFRGTSAQQTAVVWNGININSQLTGQTDFNILNTRDFTSVAVKAGGGSVIYGSGGIGGSIHLNNDLAFGNKFTNNFRLDYGSYNTLGANYNLQAAKENISISASVSRNSSDNDYTYPGTGVTNDNGQYYNTSANVAVGYKIDEKNIIRYYGYVFDGQRHFSRTLAAPSKSMYEDLTTRNLLQWDGHYGRFTSKARAAYLYEKYKYFENHENENFSYGSVRTFIAKYDAAYAVTDGLSLNTIAEYTNNKGTGSDIVSKKRNIGSGSLLLKHAVTPKLAYELGVRKEVTDAYESPVLFSAGVNYEISGRYTIKANASRNFRIPTYNDLYWQGTGNPNLNPETSYQAELGNVLKYKDVTLTLTGYYIKLYDMLRWVPGSDGVWRPENLDRARSYGLESALDWNRQWGSHQATVSGTYAYTVSRKDGSDKQLMYVPQHKATAAVAYGYKAFSAYYRHQFVGEVFNTSDNSQGLDPYNVSAVGAEYDFGLARGLAIGLQVLNLWEEIYENVAARPMPGRNYNMYLNFKF